MSIEVVSMDGISCSVSVVADSISQAGVRLTTIVAEYPRFIHAELLTHRAFSRNSASSRAIPAQKIADWVESDPAMPVAWGKNRSGMQATDEVQDADAAREWWSAARASALELHRRGMAIGLHKQIVNRILEPFAKITTLISATDWANFFALRIHKDAQPEIQDLASTIREAMDRSTPVPVATGGWHIPFVSSAEADEIRDRHAGSNLPVLDVSAARCARVSYRNHLGRADVAADLELAKRLRGADGPMHASPFEHQAMAWPSAGHALANFRGWMQYRRQIEEDERMKGNGKYFI